MKLTHPLRQFINGTTKKPKIYSRWTYILLLAVTLNAILVLMGNLQAA